MVQIYKRLPKSPKQAASISAPIDEVLSAELFKALGDATRLSLLSCLAKCARACSVSEIAECCSVDFSVVSRHLAILARAGILESVKKGRVVYYEVRFKKISKVLREMARAFDGCCDSQSSCCN